MAKFRWRLQKLLDYRRLQEKTAKDQFLMARVRRNEAESEKENLGTTMREQIRRRPTGDVDRILAHAAFVDKIEDDIRAQDAVIGVLQSEEDQAMDAWIQAKQEAEALEKLRDKAVQEWIIEENRQEQLALDEWAVMRRAA